MTDLLRSKPVTRRTAALYRRRALIVCLEAHGLTVRESGRRDRVPISYEAVYEAAMKIRARQAQADKARDKKAGVKRGGKKQWTF